MTAENLEVLGISLFTYVLNMPVQRLKVAILPLDLPCSGPITYSGEILTTGKSHRKKPDRFALNDDMDTRKTGYSM
jgi:hypothetical protein